MRKRNTAILAFTMLFALAALCWTQINLKAVAAGMTLKVKLDYTGAGPLDEKHKIHVLLFDSDPYTQETFKPMTSKTATAKNEIVTFTDLSVSPVFALAFYDKHGSNEPDSGSPAGVYGEEPSKLEPIKLEEGKTVEIVLAFDDSFTIP